MAPLAEHDEMNADSGLRYHHVLLGCAGKCGLCGKTAFDFSGLIL